MKQILRGAVADVYTHFVGHKKLLYVKYDSNEEILSSE